MHSGVLGVFDCAADCSLDVAEGVAGSDFHVLPGFLGCRCSIWRCSHVDKAIIHEFSRRMVEKLTPAHSQFGAFAPQPPNSLVGKGASPYLPPWR
jgi:hypothetical protein